MKKLLFVILLIFTPSLSFAEWRPIVNNASNNSVYLDFESITRLEIYTYVWFLEDYKNKKNELGHLSEMHYNEIDCRKKTVKILQSHYFFKAKGRDLDKSYKRNDDFFFPPPLSTFDVIRKFVCDYANKNKL